MTGDRRLSDDAHGTLVAFGVRDFGWYDDEAPMFVDLALAATLSDGRTIAAALDEGAAATVERDRLAGLLRIHGGHTAGCRAFRSPPAPCDCGWVEIAQEIGPTVEETVQGLADAHRAEADRLRQAITDALEAMPSPSMNHSPGVADARRILTDALEADQ